MNLTDDRGHYVIKVIVACSVLSSLAFIGRIISRRLLKANLLVSDYLVALGLLSAWLLSSLALWSVSLGLGKHVQAVPPGNVEKFREIAFIGLFCYSIPLTLIKISILLFYRAIFVGRLFDIGTYVTGAFVIAWGIAVPLVSIFSCHPIGAWHLTTRPAAICINDRDFFIGNSSLNILADVVILCLPMGMVWELQMSRKSKAAVSGMVLMGGCVIVASCLRLRFLLGFKRVDVTWHFVGIEVWSCVEVNVAVISACLPAMGPVLQRILESSLLVKIKGIRKTARLEDDRVSYTFNRSARSRHDEEFARLPEHTVDHLSGPEIRYAYDPQIVLEDMERVGEAR